MDKKGTSIELEKELRRVTDAFKITHKVQLNIADNAGDVQGALKLFGAKRIGCSAHKINLIAKNAMKKFKRLENLKSKLTKIVRTTKYSPGAKRLLQECCQKVGILGKRFCF